MPQAASTYKTALQQPADVYLVVHVPDGGGWGTAVNTAQSWAKDGYKVAIVSFFSDRLPSVEGVQTVAIKQKNAHGSVFSSHISTGLSIIRWFREENPKKLIVLSTRMGIVVYLLRIFYLVPALDVGMIAATHTSNSLRFFKQRTYKNPLIGFLYRLINSHFLTCLFTRQVKNCICMTRDMADDLVKNYAMSPSKIRIVPPFVDAAFFENQTEKKVVSNKILYIGRLSEEKNIKDLIEAFRRVYMQNSLVDLTIVGDGPLREQLEKQAQETGEAGSRITFVGNQSEVVPFLQNATVLALTSHYEGFPMVLIEATAIGTPLVSYDISSGPADIIQQHINGFLVEKQNVAALADALIEALNYPWDISTIRNSAEAFKPSILRKKYGEFLKDFLTN